MNQNSAEQVTQCPVCGTKTTIRVEWSGPTDGARVSGMLRKLAANVLYDHLAAFHGAGAQ